MNEIKDVVVEATDEMKKEVSKINLKDVLVTLGAGGIVVFAGIGIYNVITGKEFKFKNPFAKKSKVEEIVDEIVDTVEQA